jgi:AcrR family transcriptional regulator
MGRRASRSDEGRRERRTALLQAAIALFARNGFDATGVSEIARAAGVSHGTVFLYFPSKEALFRAAVLEPLQEFVRSSCEILDGEGGPLERVHRMVREQVTGIAGERGYLQLAQAAVAQADRFGDLLTEISGTLDGLVVRLAEVVEDGIEAGELEPALPIAVAASYIAYLNGIGLVILNEGDTSLWEHLVGQALRLFAPAKGAHHDH